MTIVSTVMVETCVASPVEARAVPGHYADFANHEIRQYFAVVAAGRQWETDLD